MHVTEAVTIGSGNSRRSASLACSTKCLMADHTLVHESFARDTMDLAPDST